MILLLDTTVLIDTLRSRNNRVQQLADMVDDGHRLATSAVNVAELYAGMRPHEAAVTNALLSRLELFKINDAIARQAGQLKAEAARRGRTYSLLDLLVAATALEHDLTLLTDNRKDFEDVPGLHLYGLG